ncbi:siderophore-iron reductase FhuF [Affinibrenneria salicis]|uniref:Siderophore-iron reductase FhuF n=1 Tax=Affinibrenneria salicis TaxID=2590031 RepID=A0A5J5G6E2_9GAMM|nr:siderophore-iron reductase FhuF [Affinibrenneria salicis]KAA9002701.1 siderophore-iron reductase FhuF [Affinibrenneria salicis]KAA9003012.1 siderophore-iron reductase FhuF [Affinibrenneria salicis]
MPTVNTIITPGEQDAHSDVGSLAQALHDVLARYRPHCLETVRFGSAPPAGSMTLAEWSSPAFFSDLIRRYGDDIYRLQPQAAREEKPLQALWAQWYFGLLVPPLMLTALLYPLMADYSSERIHVAFHQTGRPAHFFIETQAQTAEDDAVWRLVRLLRQHLIPVVNTLDGFGVLNAKLAWNNNGYLMHWLLDDIAALLPPGAPTAIGRALFLTPTLPDGADNPLFRTVIPRNDKLERRSCCQRYRLPDVARCRDCTLNRGEGG